MIKFLLILLAIICILAVSAAAYTSSLRREVFACTNDAKISLANIRYRLDPTEDLCKMGYNTVQTLNKCVKSAYENYDDNQIMVYDTIMQYLGNFFEDSQDFADSHNEICAKEFPNYEVKPGIVEKY